MSDSHYKIELIEWLDHSSYEGSGWRSWDDVQTLNAITVKSVGWVARETGEELIIIPHLHEDAFAGEVLILKRCIKRRLVLLDDGKSNEADRIQAGLYSPRQRKGTGRTRAKPRREGG